MYLYRLAVNYLLGSLWLFCTLALVVVFWTDDVQALGFTSEAALVAVRLLLIISASFSGWYYFGSFKYLRRSEETNRVRATTI